MSASADWALQQLTAYLAELSPDADVDTAYDRSATVRLGLERAAEALDSEFGFVVLHGRVVEKTGFGAAGAPAHLDALCAAGAGTCDLGGIGTVSYLRVPLEDGSIVLGRAGSEGFSPAETAVLRAMARVLSLSLRTVGALATERTLRQQSDAHAREAWLDPLTGLGNRKRFHDRLDRACARHTAGAGGFAVLYMDLDGFKLVNDTLGHAAGDELLIAVADRLRLAVRDIDEVARLGGDEFAVLLHADDPAAAARATAGRVHDALRSPFGLRGRDVVITTSIGGAVTRAGTPRPAADAAEVLRDADLAMYEAKNAGRGRYTEFSPVMRSSILARVESERELRTAVAAGQIVSWYQPIVDLQRRRVVGMEALARWEHPVQGLVPPDRFIPLAEETDLIGELGEQLLGSAVGRLAHWRAAYEWGHDLNIGFNLSGAELVRPGLADLVSGLLADAGVPPHRFLFEITENAVLDASFDESLKALRRLHEVGAGLALDDFGTGYASLSHLHRLAVDVLKVDRSFVTGASANDSLGAITSAICSLGTQLRLDLVGEGIETAADLSFLVASGCTFGQGYLFSRPLPAPAVEDWMNEVGTTGELAALWQGDLLPASA